MVTISCPFRKRVSARSTVTAASTGAPVWSIPLMRRVRAVSSGLGSRMGLGIVLSGSVMDAVCLNQSVGHHPGRLLDR